MSCFFTCDLDKVNFEIHMKGNVSDGSAQPALIFEKLCMHQQNVGHWL
jgi:hypothetical protein